MASDINSTELCMKAVNVLGGRNFSDDLVLINVLWNRKLNQNTDYLGLIVEFIDNV